LMLEHCLQISEREGIKVKDDSEMRRRHRMQ